MKNLTSESLVFKILLIALFACGCSTFHTGDVYREWTSRMGELGIYPVFPPREDISVGDAYLLPMHPYNSDLITYVGGLGMSGIRVGFLNGTLAEQGTNGESLAEMLTAEYTNRPSWPQLARDAATATNGLPYVDIPILGGTNVPDNRTSVFDGIPPRRLKEVAFPEFSVTVADQGSLSALVPVEAFMVNAGFDFSHVKSVSVKIPQAESYGIPANALVGPFLNKYVNADTNGALYLETSNPFVNAGAAMLARSTFNESLYLTLKDSTAFGFWQWGKRDRLLAEVREHTNDLYLGLITEVFYARALDVSISSSGGFGGTAGARPVTPEDLLKLNELLQKAGAGSTTNQLGVGSATNNTFVVSNQPAMMGLQDNASAIDIAKQLQQLNYGQNTLGGSMQVVSASSHAIGLRRTFAYPVAVGVRGVILHFKCKPVLFAAVDGTNYTGFPLVDNQDVPLSIR